MYYKPATTSQFYAPVRVALEDGETPEQAVLRNHPRWVKDRQHFVVSPDNSRIDVYDAKLMRINMDGRKEQTITIQIGAPIKETIANLESKLKSELNGARIKALRSNKYNRILVDNDVVGIHTSGLDALETLHIEL